MGKPKITITTPKVVKYQAPKPNADRPALGPQPILQVPDSHGYHGSQTAPRPHPSGGPVPAAPAAPISAYNPQEVD